MKLIVHVQETGEQYTVTEISPQGNELLEWWAAKRGIIAAEHRKSERLEEIVYRVFSTLVGDNQDFFRFGLIGLKPLNQGDLAALGGMDESTVSRILMDSEILFQNECLPTSVLFSAPIDRIHGAPVSSTYVKVRILAIVLDSEMASDALIAQLLMKERILIATRTIAKYRKEMGIPFNA